MVADHRKVDFLFLGPDKTGSSWLFNFLSSHSKVYIPPAKDLFYFDRYYSKGDLWYNKFFEHAQEGQLRGEITHDYIFSKVCAERILHYNSNVKIMTILRSPLDRSFSQYLYLKRGGEVGGNFRDALGSHPCIIKNSQYSSYLPYYLSLFPKEQFGIFLFDDLRQDPVAFGQKVLSFLGLEYEAGLPAEETVRAASDVRYKQLSLALKASANIARDLGFPNIVGRVKNSKLSHIFYKEFEPNNKPRLSEKDLEDCTGIFKNDIDFVQNLLSRELVSWR